MQYEMSFALQCSESLFFYCSPIGMCLHKLRFHCIVTILIIIFLNGINYNAFKMANVSVKSYSLTYYFLVAFSACFHSNGN